MVLSKMEVRTFRSTTFKIPRKERRPSEDCQYTLPVDSREAKDIENAVKRQTWDINDFDRAVSISQIKKVDNPNLEREYHEKKAELRHEGKSLKVLSEQLAFCVETEESRVKEICRTGLECNGIDHTLGDGAMGVTVWKCPDLCLRALNWHSSLSAYLLAFKIVKGRVKSVMPRLSSDTPRLEPTPNHDCHICRNTASSSVTDLTTLLRSTQYYLYEYNGEGLPSMRPRHCLPFSVIHLKRNEVSSPHSPKSRPLMSIEKPVSSRKEYPKHVKKGKSMPFSDEAGILAWRGLVMSGVKSLGLVSLFTGHKLGFNFMRSYLDVSRKIPLTRMAQILPGDVRCAWNCPLNFRGHTLSLCTMKLAEGQSSESFTSFTRGLVVKAKSAGVLCIDSSTTMFLVPSCKLAVYLGFCESESPSRVFCIICCRQFTALSPRSVWPLTSPFTPPANIHRAYQSNTGMNLGYESTVIKPSSVDLRTKHKAKIVVSLTEKSPRLSPKRPNPRQGVKRSLSFSYSSTKAPTKPLQKTARSASSSDRLGLQEDSAKLAIQSEISCDSNVRKSSFIANDSHMIGCDSYEVKSLNVDSVEDGENSRERSTADLDEGLESSAGAQAALTTELSEKFLARLATLGKCSALSMDIQCCHSDFELEQPPNEIGLRTLTNTASLTEIPRLDTIWDLHDNLQSTDMGILGSLPSPIVVGQAYPFSTSHPCSGEASAQVSLEKLERNETVLARSLNTESVQNVSVTATAKRLPFEAAENSTAKATNQKDLIAHTASPVNDAGVVLYDTKSLDIDSANKGVRVERSESELHDIIRSVDMDVEDESETLVKGVECENNNRQSTNLIQTQLLHSSNTKSSNGSNSLSSEEGASSRQQTVPGTYKKAEVEVTDSEVSLDCCEGKSQSCDRPYSRKSFSFERDTIENQSYLQNSALSTSAAKIHSLQENKSPSTSCLQSCGKELGFSFSPQRSPKFCTDRLKMLQGALKTATVLNTNQPVTDTCSPCKLVVHPLSKRDPEPDKDSSGSFDCMGLINSGGYVTKGRSKCAKPPTFGFSAAENQVTGIHTKSQLCEGGVIEISLIEDWGFQPRPSSSNKTQLAEEAFGLLDIEEEDDIDSIEGDPVVEPFETEPYIGVCDISEPEVVVCSPSEPLETFTFRFLGTPAVDEDENGISETTGDKTHLVEESVQVVVPEFSSEVVVETSERIVPEVSLPEEPSLKKESEIPQSVVVEREKAVDMVCVLHSSQDLAENICSSKLPENRVIFSGDVKELESSGSKEQSSERSEQRGKECVGPLQERKQLQNVETTKVRPLGQSTIFEESKMMESTKGRDFLIDLNPDKGSSEITAQMRSATPLEDVSHLQVTGEESEAMYLSSLLPHLLEVEKNVSCKREIQENLDSEIYSGELPRTAKGEGREIFYKKYANDKTGEEDYSVNLSSPGKCEEFCLENKLEKGVKETNCPDNFSKGRVMEKSDGVEPAEEMSKPPLRSVEKGNHRNVESKSAISTTTTQLTVKTRDRSGKTETNSKQTEKTFNATNEALVREPFKEKPLESTWKPSLSSAPEDKTRKAEREVYNSGSMMQLPGKSKEENAKNGTNSKPPENTAKADEVKKPTEDRRAIVSGTVEAKVTENSDKLVANTTKTAGMPSASSRPPSSNGITDTQTTQIKHKVSNESVHYQGTQNKTEPLRDFQRDSRLQNVKRKCTAEQDFRAKQPKLVPTHNEAVKNGRTLQKLTPPPPLVSLDRQMKRGHTVERDSWVKQTRLVSIHNEAVENERTLQKMTPPPPLVSLDRGVKRDQEVLKVARAMLRESNIRGPRLHLLNPGRPQFEYLSPPVNYSNESKRFKATNEQQSYPCWVSPLPTPFPVNNRGTRIPPKSCWCQQIGVSPHDPTTNPQRFNPVYPVYANCGRPVSQPSSCEIYPALPRQPGIVPGPWLPPNNPCYLPYPLVTPR